MVGLTSTPLPRDDGTASTMHGTIGLVSLSKTSSSPRRGVTVNRRYPNSASTWSAPRPAALITQRAWRSPVVVATTVLSSPTVTSTTSAPRRNSTPRRTASVARARLVVQVQMIASPGTRQPGQCARPEFGYPAIHLVAGDDLARAVAVALGLVLQRGQRVALLLGPGDQQGARALDGDAGPFGVGTEQLVTAGDEPGLERPGLGVEAGVQQGGVGLAGAITDVVAALDQRDGQAGPPEGAGDGAADDAGADHDDVANLVRAVHDWTSFDVSAAAAAWRQRSRCSVARSSDHTGW